MFGLEERFVLACASSQEVDVQPFVDADLHWGHVGQLALRLGLAPLVHDKLKTLTADDLVPPDVLDAFRRAHLQASACNVLLYAELEKALEALAAAGIKVIVLKGAALGEALYGSIAQRLMGDVDLLVAQHDLERAGQTLSALGYEHRPEPQGRLNPLNTGFTGELQYVHSQTGLLIELHWEITAAEPFRRTTALDTAAFLERAVPMAIGDVRCWGLSRLDNPVHLCLHLALHGFTHLRGLVDVDRVVGAGVDWDGFVERVRELRVRTAVYFALAYAQELLGTPIPEAVLDALRPSALQLWLVWAVGGPERPLARRELPRPVLYVLHVLLIDRFVDAVRLLAWFAFPGRRWIATRYRTSGLGVCVYSVVHPLSVVWYAMTAVVHIVLHRR